MGKFWFPWKAITKPLTFKCLVACTSAKFQITLKRCSSSSTPSLSFLFLSISLYPIYCCEKSGALRRCWTCVNFGTSPKCQPSFRESLFAYSRNKREKWFCGGLTKQETNTTPAPRQRTELHTLWTKLVPQCFALFERWCALMVPFFSKINMTCAEPSTEVNIVNNKRLCQGKLRNAWTLTHLYCVMPKCHWPNLCNKLPAAAYNIWQHNLP